MSEKQEIFFFKGLLEFDKFCKVLFSMIKFNIFSNDLAYKYFNCLSKFWGRYNSRVKQIDICLREFGNDQYNSLLAFHEIILQSDTPEWNWLVENVGLWVNKLLMLRYISGLDKILFSEVKPDLEAIRLRLLSAYKVGCSFDKEITNLNKLDSTSYNELVSFADNICCPTGIEEVDNSIGGFRKGELNVLLAPTNVGKSWFCVYFAKTCSFHGKGVLYFTLEMIEHDVKLRYYQAISGLVRHRNLNELERDVTYWKDGNKEVSKVSSLLDKDKLLKSLQPYTVLGEVSVVEYARGMANISSFILHLDRFQMEFGRYPDVVIVDGILDMKKDSNKDLRIAIGDVAADLSNLAKEYKCSVITTHQANRAGMKAKRLGLDNVAEAIDVSRCADVVLAVYSNEKDFDKGRVRLRVIKSRSASKSKEMIIVQNLEIGAVVESVFIEDEKDEIMPDSVISRAANNWS